MRATRTFVVFLLFTVHLGCGSVNREASDNADDNDKSLNYLIKNFSQGHLLYAIRSKKCCYDSTMILKYIGDEKELITKNNLLNNVSIDQLTSAYERKKKLNLLKISAFNVESDDRLEPYEVQDNDVLNSSKWVVAFVDTTLIRVYAGDTSKYEILGSQYLSASGMSLCPCERFFGQPQAAHRSGIAIGRDSVLTAGHGFEDLAYVKRHAIVFGFRKNNSNQVKFLIPKIYLYKIDTFYSVKVDFRYDYALLKTVRDMSHLNGLFPKISRPIRSRKVYVAGHPGPEDPDNGLPLKIAGNAAVSGINTNLNYFESNLDIFQHNSGSPVFDSLSHDLLGIVQRVKHHSIKDCQSKCALTQVFRARSFPRIQTLSFLTN